jgi:hypothetical protein
MAEALLAPIDTASSNLSVSPGPSTERIFTVRELSEILGRNKSSIKFRCSERYYASAYKSQEGWLIPLSALPDHERLVCCRSITTSEKPELSDAEADSILYGNAPEWARRRADKYLNILKACEGLSGSELAQWLDSWNREHPEIKTSYARILDARKKYSVEGISGLLARYGNRAGKSEINKIYLDEFKKLWMIEGAPSLRSCWLRVIGMAKRMDQEIDASSFPSPIAFKRRLDREIPLQAQYLARFGKKAWNKKFSSYIYRDYSGIRAGQCWVADHAQIDVAVMLPGGRPVFPWVSSFVDFKSSKWLGWLVHAEPPNSDHIFQSFFYGALRYGLCSEVYLDNGKDFRCLDFAGGRKHIRISVEEKRTTSMLGLLGITPHFALPYNAQAKIIERTFLKNKELFSKHMTGYRGGNVIERPEKLADEIKNSAIMKIEDFIKLFDDFIINCLNKNSSQIPRPALGGGIYNKERSLQGSSQAFLYAQHRRRYHWSQWRLR